MSQNTRDTRHLEQTSVATQLRQFDKEDVELIATLASLLREKAKARLTKKELAAWFGITEKQLAARIKKAKQRHPQGATLFDESVKDSIGLDGYKNIVVWPVTFYIYEQLYHACTGAEEAVNQREFKSKLLDDSEFHESYQKTQKQTAELNPFSSPGQAIDLILECGQELNYIFVPKKGWIASAPRIWVELPYFQSAHQFDAIVKKKSQKEQPSKETVRRSIVLDQMAAQNPAIGKLREALEKLKKELPAMFDENNQAAIYAVDTMANDFFNVVQEHLKNLAESKLGLQGSERSKASLHSIQSQAEDLYLQMCIWDSSKQDRNTKSLGRIDIPS